MENNIREKYQWKKITKGSQPPNVKRYRPRGICYICGKDTRKEILMSAHFREEHPEYGFERRKKEGLGYRYYCAVCGRSPGEFKELVRHYRRYHPEALVSPQSTESPASLPVPTVVMEPGIQDESIGGVIARLMARMAEYKAERDAARKELAEKTKDLLERGNNLAILLRNAQDALAQRD